MSFLEVSVAKVAEPLRKRTAERYHALTAEFNPLPFCFRLNLKLKLRLYSCPASLHFKEMADSLKRPSLCVAGQLPSTDTPLLALVSLVVHFIVALVEVVTFVWYMHIFTHVLLRASTFWWQAGRLGARVGDGTVCVAGGDTLLERRLEEAIGYGVMVKLSHVAMVTIDRSKSKLRHCILKIDSKIE